GLWVDRVHVEVARHVGDHSREAGHAAHLSWVVLTRVGHVRALVKTKAGPGLDLVDVLEPSVGPDDVKLRVLRAGLCGTDLHLEQWDDWAASTVHPPMTIGHEFYGEVVE